MQREKPCNKSIEARRSQIAHELSDQCSIKFSQFLSYFVSVHLMAGMVDSRKYPYPIMVRILYSNLASLPSDKGAGTFPKGRGTGRTIPSEFYNHLSPPPTPLLSINIPLLFSNPFGTLCFTP